MTLSSIFRIKKRQAAPVKEAAAPAAKASSPLVVSLPPWWPRGGGNAMSVSTAYRCIRLLSESVAQLPIRYLVQQGPVFAEAGGTPCEQRLRYLLSVQPSEDMTAYCFWQRIVCDIITQGNAYALPIFDPNTGCYERIQYLPVGNVTPDYSTGGATITADSFCGVRGSYPLEEILHFKNLPALGGDPRIGQSVLTNARQALDIAKRGDTETLTRFETGGVRGIVSAPGSQAGAWGGRYDTGELQNVADDITGLLAEHRIPAVGYDIKFTPFGMSSADLQFLESRKFSVREVCRFFGVHPSFVFDDTSNNYKSAENANAAFLSNTLNPLLRTIEAELTCKLIGHRLAHKRRIEFDRRALFAADLNSRAEYYGKALAAGWMTINEIRRLENMAPLADGDTLLVSSSLRPITESPSSLQ